MSGSGVLLLLPEVERLGLHPTPAFGPQALHLVAALGVPPYAETRAAATPIRNSL